MIKIILFILLAASSAICGFLNQSDIAAAIYFLGSYLLLGIAVIIHTIEDKNEEINNSNK